MLDLKIHEIDHVVLNSSDAERSLRFYSEILGLPALRAEAFREGRVPFPSVRINDGSILDFFPPEYSREPGIRNLNHIALNLRQSAETIEAALASRGVEIVARMTDNFAARGTARIAFHIVDPDGNLLELNSYE